VRSRVYRPRHEFGTIRLNITRLEIYYTAKDGESPKIGEIVYDRANNFYTAYRLDGTRLDHPSGRPKHFCRMADAGKELWHEIQNGRAALVASAPVA
jgi:hypothetical protein